MRNSSSRFTWQKLALLSAILVIQAGTGVEGGEFVGIGDLPGGIFESHVYGMSADGKVVVGSGSTAGGDEPFRWTPATGTMESLGSVSGSPFLGAANDASTNGAIVGQLNDHPSPGLYRAFYWTEEDGLVELPTASVSSSTDWARAVSDDGQTVVTFGGMWNASLGGAPIPWPLNIGEGYNVSGNGRIAVGSYNGPAGIGGLPVIWDLSTGTPDPIEIMDYDLFTQIASFRVANTVSDDGSVVAGYGLDAPSQDYQGFRWTSDTGMVLLTLPGGGFPQQFIPYGMNGDGTIIVGGSWYWSQATGLIPIHDFLVSQGLGPQMAGWRDVLVNHSGSVSKDGRIFSGNGRHRDENGIERLEGWYAILNSDPIADAGADVVVECEGDLTTVQLDGALSSDPDAQDVIEYEWSVPQGSGATLDDPSSATPTGDFPVGPTLITLTVTDGNGGIHVDDVLVTVEDTTSPVLVCTTDLSSLWPLDHTMRQVTVWIAVSDSCTNPAELLLDCTVSSNEPDNATGDGNFAGDVNGHDGFTNPVTLNNLVYDPDLDCYVGTVSLRAERDGAESGRVYSIVCNILDTADNFATASCVVVVPSDKRKK